MVLGYIAIGEDVPPGGLPRAGTEGPRKDPRTGIIPKPSMASTVGPDGSPSLGLPSPNGGGQLLYERFYIDKDADGYPDFNPQFGGFFVNGGDPRWFDVLKNNTQAGTTLCGFDEIMTTTVGKGLGMDGIFMDAIEVCAPDSYGTTMVEWTTPGFQSLVKKISDTYAAKIILQNRGPFFFDPRFEHYQFSTRPYINAFMYESYFTDNSEQTCNPMNTPYFPLNKVTYGPKVNAEGNRADGYTVLSLGYDYPRDINGNWASRPNPLPGNDYIESQREQGWMLYRTIRSLDDPLRTDAEWWNAQPGNVDNQAPKWDSSANNDFFDPGAPAGIQSNGCTYNPAIPATATYVYQAPTLVQQGATPPAGTYWYFNRIGIQEAVPGDRQVTVRWDIARDQSQPVTYNIYYTTAGSMNFATATKIASVTGKAPATYIQGMGKGRYANEYTVTGLDNGQQYLFAVRAEDALTQEETNTTAVAATPSAKPASHRAITVDGAVADWLDVPVYTTDPTGDNAGGNAGDVTTVRLANDELYIYGRITIPAAQAINGYRLYIDADNNLATGFKPNGTTNFGSEVMIENGVAYQQKNGGFNEGTITTAAYTLSPATGTIATDYEFRISRAAIYPTDSTAIFNAANPIRVAVNTMTAGFVSVDEAASLTDVVSTSYAIAKIPSVFGTATIDGSTSDWPASALVYNDQQGDQLTAVTDFRQVWIMNDQSNVYVRVVTWNAHDMPNAFNNFYFDTDNNTATGFNPYGQGRAGSELLMQGAGLYSQCAAAFNNGFIQNAPISPVARCRKDGEFAMHCAHLVQPTGGASGYAADTPVIGADNSILGLLLTSDNAGNVEYAPNAGGTIRYRLAAPPSTLATITVDGNPSEWPASALLYEDVEGDRAGGPSDIRRVWLANDTTNVYLRVDTWNPHNQPATFNNFYFDTDRTIATGFNPFGLNKIGSEMLIQGTGAYSQADGGFNNGTMQYGTVTVAPTGNANSTSWEYAIPRTLTHPSTLVGAKKDTLVFGANGTAFNVFLTSDSVSGLAETAPDLTWGQPIAYFLAGSAPTTINLTAQSANDGYVVESTATSNVGGTANSSATTILVGDDAAKLCHRGLLSFDTSSIPDNAVILSATVKVTRSSITGAPWTTMSPCYLDINAPFFGTGVGVAAADWQATAAALQVGTLPLPAANGTQVSSLLSSAGRQGISKTATTQFKIRFNLQDDADSAIDRIAFGSANHGTVAYRPVLTIQYQQ